MTNKEFDLKFEKLRKKSFAIYCVLADILEKENPEHVPSRIDQLTGQYLAEYADMWQGNKLKNNHIAELQEENEQLKSLLNADSKMKTNSLAGFEKLKAENAKLKERLKYAIVPKFKYGQTVYIIDKQFNCIFDEVYIGENKDRIILSSCIIVNHYREIEKELVFPTEAEAQKFLEAKK